MPQTPPRSAGRRILVPVLLAGLGAVGLYAAYAWLSPADAPTAPAAEAFPWARTPDPSAPGATVAQTDMMAAAPPSAGAAMATPDPNARHKPFRVDADGRLVTDQTMRLRLESLMAMNSGPALAAALDAELAGLPPAAATQARELATQYQAYQDAQRQTFPPGQAPLMPEEGLAQLTAMQALRATYLGQQAARQMFAEDDAVARRLLELMREDTSTSLSMAEKAMRAQARYDSERNRVQP